MIEKPGFGWLGTIDRRRFLQYCAALGTGVVAGSALQSMFDVMRIGPRLYKVSDSRVRMGTYVTMTALHESQSLAEEAIGRAFDEMDRLVGILSRHDPATPLSYLNANRVIAGPPVELDEVVQQALEFNRLTAGAFDVTVAPLIELFQRGAEAGRMPGDAEIAETLSRVGCDGVSRSDAGIRLQRDGMRLTLDGIAKGYIVDRASDVLMSEGIENHLVNAGGDIRARGYRAKDRPWTIAIEDPEKKGNYRDVIRLTNGAVATSGDYEVFYDEEKMFSHVVDPRTGHSPRYSTSVSVMAESVMRADALSTAVFVMKPANGLRLVDSLPVGECLLVDHEGRQQQTRNWRAFSTNASA